MKRNRNRVEAIYMTTVAQLLEEKGKEKTEKNGNNRETVILNLTQNCEL